MFTHLLPGCLCHGTRSFSLEEPAADVGGYSLNFHKHINTGEGGIIITNDSKIAKKCQLIRNHAEVTVDSYKTSDLSNMIGYNFRLTEIQAAIGIEQLKKLKNIIKKKIFIARA